MSQAPEIVSVAYWTELHTPSQPRETPALRALFDELAGRCGYTNFKALTPTGAMFAADEAEAGAEPESYMTVMPDRIAVKERRAGGVSLDRFQERMRHAVAESSKTLEIPFFWMQRAGVQALLHQSRYPSAVQYVAENVCGVDAGRLERHVGPLKMVGLRCIAAPAGQGPLPTGPTYDVQIESSLQWPPYVWVSATGSFPGRHQAADAHTLTTNLRSVYEFVEARVVPYVFGNPPPGEQ